MPPPPPKRPPRPSSPPEETASRPDPDVELPFDDEEVAPLQADDPRPQRVPQYPAGKRRGARRGAPGTPREGRDREMTPRFNTGEYEDPGHRPAFLYVERGPGAGQLVPVKQGEFVLGRASTAELRLQHPSVSRRHAQITRQGDRFTLKDLGSQNGTFINRKRVTAETEVYAGDEIALGSAIVRLRGTGLPESPHPAPATPAPEAHKARLSPRRVTLIAALLGSLVAVALVLTVTRFVKRPAPRPTVSGGKVVASPAQAAAAPSRPTPAPEAAPPVEAAPQVAEAVAQAAAAPEEEEAPVEAAAPVEEETPPEPVAAAPKPTPPAPRPVRVTPPMPAPTLSAKAVAAKSAPQVPARKKTPPAAEKAQVPHPEAETEALARYEAGDVDNALAIARRARLEQLASRLERFQAAWSAGRTALEAQDGPTAVRQFSAAQALDEELAHGWSRYGPRIRAALERAQLLSQSQ